MAGPTYVVHVSRDEPGWLAVVVNLPGANTWAPTKAELPAYVDEVIRIVADLPDDAEIAVRMLPEDTAGVGASEPEDYVVTAEAPFEEIDLDEVEVYLPDGRRLTEELAEQIREAASSQHNDGDQGAEPRPR